MRLAPIPYEKIKSGRKTVELRLNDEKRKLIAVGDEITFENTESGELLAVRVVALHAFESFEKLYQTLSLNKCGYAEEELAYADPADMRIYYSEAEEKKWGVLGIEIALKK